MTRMPLMLFAGLLTSVAAADVPKLKTKLTENGVVMTCGSMGRFELVHPTLKIGSEDRSAPIERRLDGGVLTLRYKGDGELKVELSGKRASYRLVRKPSGYVRPFQEMFVPFNFNQGGKWKVDGSSGAYPETKGSAKLFQGNGSSFTVLDANNAALTLKFSAAPYIEVQDNREWGWSIFWTGFHLWENLTEWSVDISLDVSCFEQKRLLDRFGQVGRDFKGKIRSEDELVEDAKTEGAYYSSLAFARKLSGKGFVLDRFGGVVKSGIAFAKTGYFHCEKKTVKGRERWFLVDPDGNPFFHLGICCFGAGGDDSTDVSGREGAYEWIPPREGAYDAAWNGSSGDWWHNRAVSFYKANVIRKYGSYSDAELASRMIDRVRAVGFNSIGAFSGRPQAAKDKRFPYVGSLHYGNPRMIPSVRGMFDPFDEKSRGEVAQAMKSFAASANDPLVIGYFLANEQAIEEIPRAIPALGGDWAAKHEFVARLKKRYGSIDAYNRAWNDTAADFNALLDKGLEVVTKDAFRDVKAFTEEFLEAYYTLIEKNFRAADPNHMLIGNRWQPGTANDEILCRVAGRHMDVISINYYTAGVDRKFMKRLYDWTGGKPQFWSEFYYTSTKESNCFPAGSDLATQSERGKAYRNYVEAAADLGFVTGTEWFTLIDQAATGRFFEGQNGERANTGLFNVADRPYRDLFAEMLSAHLDVYPVWFGEREPWFFDDPRYNGKGESTRTYTIGRPVAKIDVDGTQTGYPLRPPALIPSSRLVIGRDGEGLEASFKGSWDDNNLYLLVSVTDPSPMSNKQSGGQLWNGDGIEIFVGTEAVDKGGPMIFSDRHVLVSGAADNRVHVPSMTRQPSVRSCVKPSAKGDGYIVECAIPWSVFGYRPKANDTLLFDLAIDDAPKGGQRERQLMWNGSARNSSDRTSWGRLTLVP